MSSQQDEGATFWRKCSTCKVEMDFETKHYVCSVSTCRRGAGYVFCSMPCFQSHVPLMNHRSAGADDAVSPSRRTYQAEQARIREQERIRRAALLSSRRKAGLPGVDGPTALRPDQTPRTGEASGTTTGPTLRRRDGEVHAADCGRGQAVAGSAGTQPTSPAASFPVDPGNRTASSWTRTAASRQYDDRDDLPQDVLVVASKLKAYIRAASGMNTSDRVLEPLSALVRDICHDAIESAKQNERKTVLDRDLPKRR